MLTTSVDLNPALVICDEIIPGGTYWSRIIKKGTTLRITAPEGSRGISFLCYNADNAIERYNAADTAKIQFNAFLKKGKLLYSDMGRVLFSITEDTCGYHDTSGGACSRESNSVRYGLDKKWLHACVENYLYALKGYQFKAGQYTG